MLEKDKEIQKDCFCDRNYHEKEQVSFPAATKSRWVKPRENRLAHDEISLPVAVIRQSAIDNNRHWMQQFVDHHGVKLCPHGKTTMTPELFRQQLEAGAWGITVATAAQAKAAVLAGATNVLMANQLVGKANMNRVAELIQRSGIQYFCTVDSVVNARQLSDFFTGQGISLNVLIEFGVPGGRCGCRSPEAVLQLAREISELPALSLRGIELYEGVIHGGDEEKRVREFLGEALALMEEINALSLLRGPAIITGAGSAWYDVVTECLANLTDFTAIVRPGCYLIHDTGIYQDAQQKVMSRADRNQGYACKLGGDLQSALEVWAHVISRPEPGKIVIEMGKRDVAFDAGLPIPERAYRNGHSVSVEGFVSTTVMDQHTFIEIPHDSDVQVGDIMVFSTSHPCLTFDKWRYIAVSDDNDQVMEWVATYF